MPERLVCELDCGSSADTCGISTFSRKYFVQSYPLSIRNIGIPRVRVGGNATSDKFVEKLALQEMDLSSSLLFCPIVLFTSIADCTQCFSFHLRPC